MEKLAKKMPFVLYRTLSHLYQLVVMVRYVFIITVFLLFKIFMILIGLLCVRQFNKYMVSVVEFERFYKCEFYTHLSPFWMKLSNVFACSCNLIFIVQ